VSAPDEDAIERVRLLVEEFEERGARYMNPGCVDEGLAVADLHEVLRELRRARALAVDPACPTVSRSGGVTARSRGSEARSRRSCSRCAKRS
jgi:hypothetical protein